MNLIKEDYSNILKLLEGVEIKGVQSAKYVAVLAHKIENRVATWFDGHPSGYQVQDLAKEIPEPPVELN
jgi:inosine/xanthosine triphosphate pyrophosphatase family protein